MEILLTGKTEVQHALIKKKMGEGGVGVGRGEERERERKKRQATYISLQPQGLSGQVTDMSPRMCLYSKQQLWLQSGALYLHKL